MGKDESEKGGREGGREGGKEGRGGRGGEGGEGWCRVAYLLAHGPWLSPCPLISHSETCRSLVGAAHGVQAAVDSPALRPGLDAQTAENSRSHTDPSHPWTAMRFWACRMWHRLT